MKSVAPFLLTWLHAQLPQAAEPADISTLNRAHPRQLVPRDDHNRGYIHLILQWQSTDNERLGSL
jgi:hypothetical protein